MGDDEINLLVKTFDKDGNSLFDKVWSCYPYYWLSYQLAK